MYCTANFQASPQPEALRAIALRRKILVPFPERHVVPVMHDVHKSHFNQYRNLFESLLYRFFFLTLSLRQKYIANFKYQRKVEMQPFSAQKLFSDYFSVTEK